MSTDVIQLIEMAIAANPRCQMGLMLRPRAFYWEKDSPELLTMLFADDPSLQYFYGHVLAHPKKPDYFVAVLTWSEKFINAQSIPSYFAQYHAWVKERGYYEPCSTQTPEDAYGESESFLGAVLLLKKMIDRFDVETRFVQEGSPYEAVTLTDFRILNIYGIADDLR